MRIIKSSKPGEKEPGPRFHRRQFVRVTACPDLPEYVERIGVVACSFKTDTGYVYTVLFEDGGRKFAQYELGSVSEKEAAAYKNLISNIP